MSFFNFLLTKIGLIKSDYIKNYIFQPLGLFPIAGRFKILRFFCFFILGEVGYSQAPAWLWAKDAHTTAAEWATDVAVDTSTGNVVAVGVFNSDLSAFYGGAFSAAIGGGFVAKYDASGNVLWAFKIGSNQDDACNGVTISPIGNVYVTGYFQNIADFRGNSITSTILTSNGGKDMFVAKYNPAGQLQWVRQGGGISDDEGLAVCTNTNNIFVTGYFTNSGTFSGIPTASNRANENIFVDCYDTNGNIQWLTDAGSGQSCFGRDIAADNNDVYITGDFKNTTLSVYNYGGTFAGFLTNSSPSNEDIFVMSLAVTGPYNWTRGVQSIGSDLGKGIAQNTSGVFITGATSSSANFPSYASNPVAVGALGLDIFVAQLSKLSGNTNWVKSEPGNNDQIAFSVCIDTSNLICVSGAFNTGINFGGGPSITSSGNEDVFIAAYSQTGTIQWATQAGDNGSDVSYAIASHSNGEIYTAGSYENNAAFGTNILTADSPPNIFVAKIGCAPISNNSISAAQTICANQIPATLIGSTPSGGSSLYTYLWEQSPNNLTWSSATGTNNTQNYSPPALTANTYYRRTVISSGGCSGTSTSSSILITVNQLPTVANAGIDSSICSSSINLYANTPVTGTGSWLQISGTGTITSVTSPTTSVSGLSGTTIFVWSISNGVCAASKDTVTIKVYTLPSASNAGPNQNLCASTTTALSANTPTVGTGAWSLVSGGGIITATANPNSSVTGLPAGSNVFMWTISNGTCPASSGTVTIFVNAPPTVANAGIDQELCSASTATLSANTILVGSGVWSVITGSALISNANLFNSAVSNLQIGLNTFVWTTSNNSCLSSSDTVNILVYSNPTIANAGSDMTQYSISANMNGNTPVTGTGSWAVISGSGTFANSANPTTQVTNLQFGQNIIRWTISNGVCPASFDDVIITINELSIPNGFSPNSDGANDNFEIPGITQFTNVKLEVFNRWGNLVYESTDYKNDWSGKNATAEELTDDTYYFTLQIPNQKTYKGFVVLKRK